MTHASGRGPDTRPAPPTAADGPSLGDQVALGMRTVGELAITLGVIILLFVVYELYFTGIATEHKQTALRRTFRQQVQAHVPPSATPALGTGIAEMYAPRLGRGWHFIVVEGTGETQLAAGPGHYEYPPRVARELGISKPLADGATPSAFPGQIGNFVVSGHRTTHAHPFFDANEFRPGDAVIFETTTTWYVYKVTSTASVLPNDIGVAFPVPGDQAGTPSQALVTLTTCNPRYSASHRLVIRGVLALTQPLSAGNPAALTTGRA